MTRVCVYADGGSRCTVCGRQGLALDDGSMSLRNCRQGICGVLPAAATRLRNFVVAAAQHVAAGMPMASEQDILARHDICSRCEHLVSDACNLCGCPVRRMAGYVSKLSWADQECPAGKWGKVDPK